MGLAWVSLQCSITRREAAEPQLSGNVPCLPSPGLRGGKPAGHGNVQRTSNPQQQRTGRMSKHQQPPVATENPKQQAEPGSNTIKDPDDWTTGDESMTGAQASYLKTLCEEAGEAFDPGLTKAEASKRIDALQEKTGRGR